MEKVKVYIGLITYAFISAYGAHASMLSGNLDEQRASPTFTVLCTAETHKNIRFKMLAYKVLAQLARTAYAKEQHEHLRTQEKWIRQNQERETSDSRVYTMAIKQESLRQLQENAVLEKQVKDLEQRNRVQKALIESLQVQLAALQKPPQKNKAPRDSQLPAGRVQSQPDLP